MVTREILEKRGVTAEAWKKRLRFSRDMATTAAGMSPPPDTPEKEYKYDKQLTALVNRIRARIEEGRNFNLRESNYRTIQALDLAWNASARQISPTLVADLIRTHRQDGGPAAENALKDALHSAGLRWDEIVYDTGEKNKDGQPVKALNVPAFNNVIVPLVRAYGEVRIAKLVNDRNLKPFHKFESPINDPDQRLKCEALSSRVELMRQQYGYLESLRQAVMQMIVYHTSLQFTMESWHFDEQYKLASADDAKFRTVDELDKDGKSTGKQRPVLEGDEIRYTVREGLRYYHPHPARMFWDQAHPTWTFNTDTGCEYAGYWRVMRYKEIRNNPDYYNTDRVNYGSTTPWWSTSNATQFFNAVYNSSVMDWPASTAAPEGVTDREKYLAENTMYTASHDEKAVCVIEYRERIIPKNYGLGDYDQPIWARFVVAGDNYTILYAEPLCYPPVIAWRDNGDDRKSFDVSMALKLVPFQDMLSNQLSQFILTVKQNLTNITLIDESVLDEGGTMWAAIKNLGERMYRGLNIFKFNSKKWNRYMGGGNTNPASAFVSHRFTQLDANGILQSIKVVLDLAERVLQFSAQEIAQAASHEQTRKEMEMIQGATGNILQFTSIPVDAAMAAQANQIYQALMNYGDDDMLAVVPLETPISKDTMERLGLTYVFDPRPESKKAMVRLKRSALDLLFFAVVPSYWERVNNIDQARAISEMVRDWFINNPMGQSALGPEQLVDLFNVVARKLLVLPLETPIRNVGLTTQEQAAAQQQQLQGLAQQVLQQAKEGMVPLMQLVLNLYKQTGVPMPDLNQTQPQANANPSPEVAPAGGTAPNAGAMAVAA